jgi:diguanylate cyclase (GGDEF)-like protein
MLSIAILDIDHFKAVNDAHGHPVGDVTLRKVAEMLGPSIRGSDLIGRFGGEEFLAIFPGIGRDEALQTASRLLAEVENVDISIGPQNSLRVTLSAGVAEYDRTVDDPRSLLTRADRALYQAKERGRNRACS